MNLSAISLSGENFKHLSMNSSIDTEKFEPEPIFSKTTNEIKDNHLKSIVFATMNLSAITLFDENLEQLIAALSLCYANFLNILV